MMFANCLGWTIYSTITQDYFVYCSNIPGLIMALYYLLVCFKFSPTGMSQELTLYLPLVVTTIFSVVGLVHFAIDPSRDTATLLW
jgi:hypothetical protein